MPSENSKITEAFLGYEDHLPVVRISCESPRKRSVVSTGNIDLRRLDFGNFLTLLLRVAGVREWSRLKGAYVRVVLDEHGGVESIGHILDEVFMDCKTVEVINDGGQQET